MVSNATVVAEAIEPSCTEGALDLAVSDTDSSNIEGTPPPPAIGKRFVSFNVCGVKNVLNFFPWYKDPSFSRMFEYLKADVVCFQELKVQARDLSKDVAIVPGYTSYFTFSTSKKGYSGVGIYVKNNIGVLKAEEGLTGFMPDLATKQPYRVTANSIGGYPAITEADARALDAEGRALVLDLGGVVLIGLYCPANSMGDQEEFRNLFFDILDQRVRNLTSMGRKVIVLGDINVAREVWDSGPGLEMIVKEKKLPRLLREDITGDLEKEWKCASFPRRVVNAWNSDILVDSTRLLFPERRNMYTCWNQLLGARAANFGSRIDLIMSSKDLKVHSGDILPECMGSDHCPIYTDLEVPGLQGSLPAPPLSKKRTQIFEQTIRSHFTTSKDRPNLAKASRTDTLPQKIDSQSPRSPKRARMEKSKSPGAASGQKPISAFFTAPPKQSTPNTHSLAENQSEQTQGPMVKRSENAEVESTLLFPKVPKDESSNACSAEIVENRFKSQNSWKQLFALKKPLCYHKEECFLQLSKKPGPNKGRHFWSCRRPYGPETDPESRCSFFKWA